MTQAAHNFLDLVRGGADASGAEITEALRATGDIEFETVIRSHRTVGTWETFLPSQVRPEPFGGLLASCPRTLDRIAREAAS